jgi:hypothetical protein
LAERLFPRSEGFFLKVKGFFWPYRLTQAQKAAYNSERNKNKMILNCGDVDSVAFLKLIKG